MLFAWNITRMNGLNCVENEMLMYANLCVNMVCELYKNIIVCKPLEINCD